MSRLRLSWYNLEPRASGDFLLKIPVCNVYSKVIDRAFPDLRHIGWREDTQGTCYTYIKSINLEHKERLTGFLDLLGQLLFITPTEILRNHFKDGPDEVYALDFNFEQGKYPLTYTEIGNYERLAKDSQNEQAIEYLTETLARAIRQHPTLKRADIIVGVPPRPSKNFHLPVKLVEKIGCLLNREVGLRLTKIEHEKLKSLQIDDKLKVLKDVFRLHEPINGKTIVIVDDLCQSGVTLWSLGHFLKQKGAKEVYGLACVKSWSDSDNV